MNERREATTSQNNQNVGIRRHNTSGYKGVTWNKWHQKWRAQIAVDGRNQHHLGYFDDPREAALAYDAAAVELHGEFAKTNGEING